MQGIWARRSRGDRPMKELAALAGLLALVGCSLATDPSRPQILAITGGDMQSAIVGTPLPAPLTVVVIDQNDIAVPTITVTWAITSGGGTLSATTTQTDDNGVASVTYTAGPTAGSAAITATVSGIGTVGFAETITAT